MTIFRKLAMAAVPAALIASPVPAQPAAQQAPAGAAAVAAGAKIMDTKGGEVGTVTRIDGQFVVLKTDKHEARLPLTSFTPHQGGLLMAMTRDELNAEIEKTMASAAAKLVAGAPVTGSQGNPVGTIDKLDGEFVILKLTSGALVRLPRTGIAPGANGAVIGMTAAQLEEAAAAAGAKTE
jgi:hypothetical protein